MLEQKGTVLVVIGHMTAAYSKVTEILLSLL